MFDRPEPTYRELREQLERLADEVRHLTGRREGYERWRGMRDQAQMKWSEARDVAGQRAHEADEFVRRSPWQAVSVALVVGVLLGLISGKSHRGRGR